ncbi:hypothetical protein BD324DRAFT_632132 [Kockovaella imperatae]|uniref:SET domain-containing protein n=1 Tax=Kockovaella imperatae TaxID=4999 RepID=A0A1Y1UB59_9TREE|nr:hypothetical protein BD324DRAFT_632132 [Kockovaella imperatae]ORX35271.1 hypothetical protein BD324DRAFT_632132 [Kockovaella imperatae]
MSEGSEESDTVEGCSCTGVSSLCTVTDGDNCECVESFGNFYTLGPSGHPILNLDAVPYRLPLVECGAHCSCSVKCFNRTTQRGVNLPVEIRQTKAGLGAFLSASADAVPIEAGTFIALYAGEYLSTSEARSRWQLESKDNYTLSLRLANAIIHIDPRYKGNVGRFFNHSCDPNCVILIVYWGGGWPRAAIFSKSIIQPSEELTFDYGNASGDQDAQDRVEGCVAEDDRPTLTKCLCGSVRCRGYMPFDSSL